MGVLQHGRFILRWCGTPFLTKRWIHNRLEIENRLVLGSKIILKNWAKRAVWGIGLAVCVGCVIVIIKFAGKTENKTITVNSAETINTEDATATEVTEKVSGTESGDTDITRISDSMYEKSFGEIDGNRVSVQVEQPYEEEGTDYYSHQKLFWNGTMIWEYSEVNYVEPSRVEYLDLDEDGEKEIFYTFAPRVNSAGLVEYVVLKQKGDEWQPLQMQQEGNLAENNFAVSVIYQGNYNVEISCEGIEKTIAYNVQKHYERMVEDETETSKKQGFENEPSLYQPYLDDTVAVAGDEYGCLAAWGMWDIKPALYDNEVKNCLVATYGIQGLAEKHDFFGYLDVYFNYDSEENYQILDLQFEEYDPTATVTDSSTDGDETAENQADSVAGAAASYEQVIDEYRDMVQNHFYMDLQAKDRDGNIVHVFDNYEFGYRTNFDLCSGGLIEVTSSVSAAEYDVVFYRIGTDGASPVVEDVFRCVGTQTGNDTVSFQYTESGKEKKEDSIITRKSIVCARKVLQNIMESGTNFTRKNISERSTGDEVCGHMITLGTGVPGTAM